MPGQSVAWHLQKKQKFIYKKKIEWEKRRLDPNHFTNKHRMGEDHPRIISGALWAEAQVYHVCKLLKQ
jgi:hypothetical protein